MTLTDRNKADLLGLLSSLGEPAADARAVRMAADDPEAAEYLRQMRAIATALRPPEDTDLPLNTRQSALLLNRILERANKLRPGPKDLEVPRRLWRLKYVAMAAAILLVLGPGLWFFSSTGNRGQVGEAVLIPVRGAAGVPVSASRFRMMPGSTLVTGGQLGGLLLRNGNRISVDRESQVDVISEQEISVTSGVCFIRAIQPVRVSALTARLEVVQGTARVQIKTERIKCEVFSGAVTAEVAGKRFDIWAGTVWEWDLPQNTSRERPLESGPPTIMVERVESALLDKGPR